MTSPLPVHRVHALYVIAFLLFSSPPHAGGLRARGADSSTFPSAQSTDTCLLLPVTLPTTQTYTFGARVLGPQCTDGTPYIFFKNASLFVVHLNGGAFCANDTDCADRKSADPSLFTSSTLPLSGMRGYDILDSDPFTNPTFSSATHVWFPYCSQDLWAGGRAAGSASNATGVVFRGEDNMLAAWQALGIGSSAVVVLSGSSAGGIGAMRLANYLAASGWLTTNNVQVRLLLDSSWFIDFAGGFTTTFQTVQQAPLTFFSVPVDSDALTAAFCNGSSSLLRASTAGDFNVPCCLDSQCMVGTLFNASGSTRQGVLDGFLIASKYDVFSLVLSNTLSTISSSPSGFMPTLSLLDDYGGQVYNSLNTLRSYPVQGGLTVFEPPCIGHVWLLPEQTELKSNASLSSFDVTLAPGMWGDLMTNNVTLKSAVDLWWTSGGRGGRGAQHLITRCRLRSLLP